MRSTVGCCALAVLIPGEDSLDKYLNRLWYNIKFHCFGETCRNRFLEAVKNEGEDNLHSVNEKARNSASHKSGYSCKLAGKKGRAFQFNLYFETFHIYYILYNYAIPQLMPHSIPQTHASFYPHRCQSGYDQTTKIWRCSQDDRVKQAFT